MICDECQALYEEVGDRARDAKVFGKVRRTDDALKCRAKGIDPDEAEAIFFAEVDDDHTKVWVGLWTTDRWLSQSIEADLMHTGDKLEDLLEEELIDQGYEVHLAVDHFRDDSKRYIFRSPVPVAVGEETDGPVTTDHVTQTLLAYEAAFRELGDMSEDGEA